MDKIAYIQEEIHGKLYWESNLLRQYLEQCHPEVIIISLSSAELFRSQDQGLTPFAVAGNFEFVERLLAMSNHPHPTLLPDYPEELSGYLHRKIESGTLRDLTLERCPIFVKPQYQKLFTGFVCNDPFDYRFKSHRVNNNEPLWLGEVVQWVSEWRVYVVHGKIAHLSHYNGSRSARPRLRRVEEMVSKLSAENYVMDVGVLANGRTALIEINDGIAVGAYEGCHHLVYGALLVNRWQEMMQERDMLLSGDTQPVSAKPLPVLRFKDALPFIRRVSWIIHCVLSKVPGHPPVDKTESTWVFEYTYNTVFSATVRLYKDGARIHYKANMPIMPINFDEAILTDQHHLNKLFPIDGLEITNISPCDEDSTTGYIVTLSRSAVDKESTV